MIYGSRNAEVSLYHNGTRQMNTESYGIYVRDQVRAAIYYDHDTGYYFNGNGTSRMVTSVTNTSYFGVDTNKGYAQGYGTYSTSLHKMAYMSFDWNANYNYYYYHGLASTDINGNFSDSMSLNSFNDINLRLDSNNNNGNSYVRIHDNGSGNSQNVAYIGRESGNSIAYFYNRVYGAIYYDHDSNYYFDGNGTSQMARIDINDYIRHRGDTNTYIGFNTNDRFRVVTGGSERFWISTGEVRSNLVFRCTSDVVAYYSDDRLKTKEGKLENALDKIMRLDGFYYRINDTAKEHGYTDESLQLGLSAQQVQAILPEVVTLAPFDSEVLEDGSVKSKSGLDYLTIKYERMIPLLVEGAKEQQNQYRDLQKIIVHQQKQLKEQQSQIDELKEMIKSLMK